MFEQIQPVDIKPVDATACMSLMLQTIVVIEPIFVTLYANVTIMSRVLLR